ncbi:hypothetical protein GCM10027044_19800 [Hymenobacter ruber]
MFATRFGVILQLILTVYDFMKKLLLLVVLLALAAGGYYYYRSLKQGPSGALVSAAAAVQTHDMAMFEKYVDVNSVTTHLVDDVAQQSSILTSLLPGGSLMMGGAMRLLKPALAKAAHQEVQRYVETGSLEAAAAAAPKRMVNISLTGLANKVVSPDSEFKGIKYTREEGDNAFVGLEVTQPKYDTTMVVEVKMRRQGDHWQMTQITNSGELLRGVARLEKKRLLN